MGNKTIIIAEDEIEVRNYLEMALRCEGYRVRPASNGAELLEAAAESNGELALVILDLTMPEQDGLETLRDVRRSHPRVPVIVFSGAASPAKVVEAMQSGACDFLAKPITHEQLIRAVRRATQGPAGEGVHDALADRVNRSEPLYGSNPRMQAIRAAIRQIAAADVPVVLRGESGVGKEVLAREIHAQSSRASKPFLKINCAALPLELLESELFGYERGAFTGAMKSTPGKFEIADGGTILLDEIGDMDFKLQAKLLHVLQDNEFQRLGGRETVRVNVRILAATHCDLESAIEERRFREDLYYRLNVISIDLPPLRERKDEILPLAEHFLRKHAAPGAPAPVITENLEQALLSHRWPGNIRELENIIRKLLVFGDPDAAAEDLRRKSGPVPVSIRTRLTPAEEQAADDSVLDRVQQLRNQEEAEAILQALQHSHWNRKRAAAALNIDYKGLLYKMKKLGIGPRSDAAGRIIGKPRAQFQ